MGVLRVSSRRHRDEFLRSQIRLIEPFCARHALTRLTREVKKEHVLEISARVQALGKMEIVLKPLSLVNADVTTTLPMW